MRARERWTTLWEYVRLSKARLETNHHVTITSVQQINTHTRVISRALTTHPFSPCTSPTTHPFSSCKSPSTSTPPSHTNADGCYKLMRDRYCWISSSKRRRWLAWTKSMFGGWRDCDWRRESMQHSDWFSRVVWSSAGGLSV